MSLYDPIIPGKRVCFTPEKLLFTLFTLFNKTSIVVINASVLYIL